jgi:hypothetical protein
LQIFAHFIWFTNFLSILFYFPIITNPP